MESNATHELFVQLAASPDTIRRIESGHFVRIVRRRRDRKGDLLYLAPEGRPASAGGHVVRWFAKLDGAPYLVLELERDHRLSLVRLAGPDRVQALTAHEFSTLYARLQEDMRRRSSFSSSELDALLIPLERSGETTIRVAAAEPPQPKPAFERRNGRLVLLEPRGPVTLAVHEEFAVRMVERPSTGYSWVFGEPLDENLLRKVRTESEPSESDRPGSANTYYLIFKALAPGKTRIVLHLRPPSGEEPEFVSTYELIIRA